LGEGGKNRNKGRGKEGGDQEGGGGNQKGEGIKGIEVRRDGKETVLGGKRVRVAGPETKKRKDVGGKRG